MPLDQIIHLIDLLKWPVVVLICFGTFVAVFRSQLGELISRITSISKHGVKTGPSTSGYQRQLGPDDSSPPPKTIVAVELSIQDRNHSATLRESKTV
jgi:hypothetical protein